MYRRVFGPQGRSGRVRNISHSPGFDPRTVQPVANRYTDYPIPAHHLLVARLRMSGATSPLPSSLHGVNSGFAFPVSRRTFLIQCRYSSSSYSTTALSVWPWLPLQLMPIPLHPLLSFSIVSHRASSNRLPHRLST